MSTPEPNQKLNDESKGIYIYFHKFNRFFYINSTNYPKDCEICLPKYQLIPNKESPCRKKFESWLEFRDHVLNFSEKSVGHKIIFLTKEDLPKEDEYKMYRLYGNLNGFLRLERSNSFYVFDLVKKKFIERNKLELKGKYFPERKCTFCPISYCGKTIFHYDSFLIHISQLEKKFKCFLFLNDLKSNNILNKSKLDAMILSFKRENQNFNDLKENNDNELDYIILDTDSESEESNAEIQEKCEENKINSFKRQKKESTNSNKREENETYFFERSKKESANLNEQSEENFMDQKTYAEMIIGDLNDELKDLKDIMKNKTEKLEKKMLNLQRLLTSIQERKSFGNSGENSFFR